MLCLKPTRSQFANRTQYVQAWLHWKRHNDPRYRFILNTYSNMYRLLRIPNAKFCKSIGCDGATLRLHLESQFTPEMNWDNYGKGKLWEVNHKYSLVEAFEQGGMEALKQAAHYLNTEPCLTKTNRKGKNGKKHTTRNGFMHSTCEVIEEADDYIKVSLRLRNKEPRYPYIILDRELKDLISKGTIFFQQQADSPCYRPYSPTVGTKEPMVTIWTFLFPNQKWSRRVRRVSGDNHDFRKQHFRVITEEDIVATRKAVAKRSYEKKKHRRKQLGRST